MKEPICDLVDSFIKLMRENNSDAYVNGYLSSMISTLLMDKPKEEAVKLIGEHMASQLRMIEIRESNQ